MKHNKYPCYLTPEVAANYIATRNFLVCPLCVRMDVQMSRKGAANPHAIHCTCTNEKCNAKWVLTTEVSRIVVTDPGPHPDVSPTHAEKVRLRKVRNAKKRKSVARVGGMTHGY